MQKTEFALKFETLNNQNDGACPVIIVAAGSSSRMQGTDKQFSLLGGIPVLARTLCAFENSSVISEITVVTRAEKIADIEKLAERYGVKKLKTVIEGGATRADSVRNGIALYKDKANKILVHDGARPLVSDEVIRRVATALKDRDSVTCGVRPKDTIKVINEQSVSVSTPDRASLIAVQTPQGVNVDLFLKITENADMTKFTDDTSVMESAGIETLIVEGDYKNIKITTPEDLDIAEVFACQKEW